jgi:phage baseplate assembly protein W
MATINRIVKEFSDLDLMFQAHPYTSDVNRKFNLDAIKASVKNLILTKNYERPFHPEIGSQVTQMMFENYTPAIKNAVERSIMTTIERFEPRVRMISVELIENQDTNEITVEIVFAPKNVDTPITITQTLGRLR